MKSSDAVRSTMLRFYERLTASDIEGLDALVSDDAATLVIGTAPLRGGIGRVVRGPADDVLSGRLDDPDAAHRGPAPVAGRLAVDPHARLGRCPGR